MGGLGTLSDRQTGTMRSDRKVLEQIILLPLAKTDGQLQFFEISSADSPSFDKRRACRGISVIIVRGGTLVYDEKTTVRCRLRDRMRLEQTSALDPGASFLFVLLTRLLSHRTSMTKGAA